jgi:hypothetical protein
VATTDADLGVCDRHGTAQLSRALRRGHERGSSAGVALGDYCITGRGGRRVWRGDYNARGEEITAGPIIWEGWG